MTGLCKCGCGEPTSIAPQTKTSAGWVKGEPVPYRSGHAMRGRPAWNRQATDAYHVDDETGCWNWQLHRDRAGYAITNKASRPVRAARAYWETHHGMKIPPALQIDHLCRNKACVNPDHLEVVTPEENMRRRPATKLTLDVARQIKASSDAGVDLARRFGISPQQVCNIRKGRCWVDAS